MTGSLSSSAPGSLRFASKHPSVSWAGSFTRRRPFFRSDGGYGSGRRTLRLPYPAPFPGSNPEFELGRNNPNGGWCSVLTFEVPLRSRGTPPLYPHLSRPDSDPALSGARIPPEFFDAKRPGTWTKYGPGTPCRNHDAWGRFLPVRRVTFIPQKHARSDLSGPGQSISKPLGTLTLVQSGYQRVQRPQGSSTRCSAGGETGCSAPP